MIKFIKCNENNFFMNKVTGEKIDRYDPNNPNLEFVIKEKTTVLHVDGCHIHKQFGGQIVFEYGPDKYIIEDGYTDYLIKAGYIIFRDYDTCQELDKDKGIKMRHNILSQVNSAIGYIVNNTNDMFSIKSENSIKVVFTEEGYEFTVYIDTINGMVNKNQQRKLNQLPFYPFDKNMDKYGTLYISVFARRVSKDVKSSKRFSVAEKFIERLIKELNDYDSYHCKMIKTTKKIINWGGI